MSSYRQSNLNDYWGENVSNRIDPNIISHFFSQQELNYTNTILSINIGDSIENKLYGLISFIQKYKPLIVFLCEVHSYEEDLLKFKQSFKNFNYTILSNCLSKSNNYYHNTAKRKRSNPKGGICALISDKCEFTNFENLLNHRGIKINVKSSTQTIDVFGIYAPSCSELFDFRKIWWNKFADIIESSKNEILIIGDLNIHLIEELDHNSENNCPDIEGVDRILMKVYDIWRTKNPVLRYYTYNKGDQYSRIDYSLISPDLEELLDPFYLPFNVEVSTDHCPVGVSLRINDMNLNLNSVESSWKRKFFNCRNFKLLEKQTTFMNRSEFTDIQENSTINETNDFIIGTIKSLCSEILGFSTSGYKRNDYQLPLNIKELQINFNRVKNALASYPFAKTNNMITSAIKNLEANSSKFLISQPILNRLGWVDWRNRANLMSHLIYKELRKELRDFNCKKIKRQVDFILNLEKRNPKVFNRKFNWKKQEISNFSLDKIKCEDGSVTSDPICIMSELTSFWSKIFSKDPFAFTNNFNSPWFKTRVCRNWKSVLKGDLSLTSPFSVEEVIETINQMGKNKAAGPDEIPTEAYKHVHKNFIIHITALFNQCLLQ